MNTQEAFDKIWERAKTAKRTHGPDGDSCVYRGEDGSACFVGCLIPDELYDPEFDEDLPNVALLLKCSPELKQWFADIPLVFLEDAQLIHDQLPFSMWKDELVKLAKEYGLEVPE